MQRWPMRMWMRIRMRLRMRLGVWNGMWTWGHPCCSSFLMPAEFYFKSDFFRLCRLRIYAAALDANFDSSSFVQVAHALLTQSATNLPQSTCCCSFPCHVDLWSLWVAGEDHQIALFAVSLWLLLLPVMNCILRSQSGLATQLSWFRLSSLTYLFTMH